MIADVCGGYDRLESAPSEETPPNQLEGIRQIVFFASPEGQLTRSEENGGVFTQIFLDVVREGHEWPQHASFFRSMKESLEQNQRQAFRIWSVSETDSMLDFVLGARQSRGRIKNHRLPEIYRSEEQLNRYPLPKIHSDDNQKGRWGGKSSANGRRLEAFVVKHGKNDYELTLRVISTDGSPLHEPVRIHHHETYRPQVVTIRKCNPVAEMKRHEAYETLTVGVEVPRMDGRRTVLELDLQRAFQKAGRIYKRSKQ